MANNSDRKMIHAFVERNYDRNELSNANVFIYRECLYSYSYSHPLALRINGQCFMNSDYASHTTSSHLNYLKCYCNGIDISFGLLKHHGFDLPNQRYALAELSYPFILFKIKGKTLLYKRDTGEIFVKNYNIGSIESFLKRFNINNRIWHFNYYPIDKLPFKKDKLIKNYLFYIGETLYKATKGAKYYGRDYIQGCLYECPPRAINSGKRRIGKLSEGTCIIEEIDVDEFELEWR